jgi:hypothetical protein
MHKFLKRRAAWALQTAQQMPLAGYLIVAGHKTFRDFALPFSHRLILGVNCRKI